ncbi:hypothetical protein [Nocardia seriolae]|uniref:Uncharacterized protein n=1 Tax=Nocardia seriolae TaxID=37332 RepID=A0ABC9YT89_9NOCA|nr:hypothetical protein [Nocardia seriolae]BEK97358.1 hypothetical protein NSER024013_52640 [Nocardia seriolae]GAM46572.1 hypothetical protein NS07_v2contig00032-0049 [Nocardia seriolae]GAP28530.1 hypothetical protein NSK11_contig00037-0051 [Nocardia seriolae]
MDLFAGWCTAEQQAAQRRQGFAHYDGDPAAARIAQLSMRERQEATPLLTEAADRARELGRRSEPWAIAALTDVHLGQIFEWQSRATAMADLLGHATELLTALGYTMVEVTAQDPAHRVAVGAGPPRRHRDIGAEAGTRYWLEVAGLLRWRMSYCPNLAVLHRYTTNCGRRIHCSPSR